MSIKFGKMPKSISIGSTLNLGKRVVLNPTKAVTTLTWSSSKPEVATVDEKGRVTGVSKGKTTITVTTANGKKRKITIKVK